MLDVSSADIAAYLPLTKKLAHRLEAYGRRWGAEYDDLEQEGRIAVWQLLRHGFPVSPKNVEHRMLDYLKVCKRQGFGYDEPAAE